MSKEYKKANIAAMAEAIYQRQCDYVGADHPATCVEILTTALQSFEDDVLQSNQQNEALLAQVDELRVCEPCPCGDIGFFVVPNNHTGDPEQEQCEHCYTNPASRFNALNNTPATALDSLKARIEADTIDRCADLFRELSVAGNLVKEMPRKYQSSNDIKADK